MSEQLEVNGPAVDPDATPPPASETPPTIDTLEAQPAPEEPDEPEAIEIQAGQRYIPVGVAKALREENKALKAQAEKVTQLEQALNEAAPYVQFLRANPQIMQQPAQPQHQTQPPTQADPLVESTAKRYDLYTADGKLDLDRAAAIVDDQRKVAREEASKLLEPVTTQHHQQQLTANLQWMTSLKDADGRPLEQAFIDETVRSIYGALPRQDALRVLADPAVAQIVGYTALGRQAAVKKSAPQPPAGPPLHVESAGGASGVVLGEDSRRLAKMAGFNEKDFAERAKRYQPNTSNVLE